MTRVLVRGAGDVGSAVAHRLFGAGYGVVVHEEPEPTATRRGMAFADAAFDGHAVLAGVRADPPAWRGTCRRTAGSCS
jgi:xanthine dehydrogenase accessory factor